VCFTFYAAAAAVWSPYPLSAVKIVGYLIGIYLAFLVLEKGARTGLVDQALIVSITVGSLLAAIFQTAAFGDYSIERGVPQLRFTSFVGAQQFAALLVALLAAVLWLPEISFRRKLSLLLVLVLGCYLNGSRTWFAGALIVGFVYCVCHARKLLSWGVVTCAMLMIGVHVAALLGYLTDDWASILYQNRIFATARALSGEVGPARQIGLGTYLFRVNFYSFAIREIASSGSVPLIFGHGSGSGGTVALQYGRSATSEFVDFNRVFHNEWLRVLYEWGVVGLILWTAVLASFGASLLVVKRRYPRVNVLPAIAYFSALLVALATENILAGASNAVNIGLAILVGLVWQRPKMKSWASPAR